MQNNMRELYGILNLLDQEKFAGGSQLRHPGLASQHCTGLLQQSQNFAPRTAVTGMCGAALQGRSAILTDCQPLLLFADEEEFLEQYGDERAGMTPDQVRALQVRLRTGTRSVSSMCCLCCVFEACTALRQLGGHGPGPSARYAGSGASAGYCLLEVSCVCANEWPFQQQPAPLATALL